MTFMGFVVLAFSLWFINISFGTWAVMVGIGNLHHLSPVIPAYGFWEVFSVWAWFAAALSIATVHTRSNEK